MYVVMNVVRALADREADFEEAFLTRERLLGQAPGFRGFELLRRDGSMRSAHGDDDGVSEDGEALGREYVVLTRWESEEDFRGWVKSDLFRRAHREERGRLAASNELRAYDVLDVEVEV
jgi:heme oxygenase (staphylobilin-producing)